MYSKDTRDIIINMYNAGVFLKRPELKNYNGSGTLRILT